MTTAQTPKIPTKTTLRTTHAGRAEERTSHHAYVCAVWAQRPNSTLGPGVWRWSTSRALADKFATTLRGWGLEGVTVEPVTHLDGSPVTAAPAPRKGRAKRADGRARRGSGGTRRLRG